MAAGVRGEVERSAAGVRRDVTQHQARSLERKVTMRVLSGVLISAVVLACQPQAEPLLNTDKTAMRAVTDSFTAYVVTHRDSMAAAQYAGSATLMPPNHGVVQGRAAIRAFIAAFPSLSHVPASPLEIAGRADLLYVRGTDQMTFASPPRRPAIEDHAK